MAQKEVVITECDFTGEEGAQRITFGYCGVSYEIDLSDKYADDLQTFLRPFIEHARRLPASARRSSSTRPAATSTKDAAEIREWAKRRGLIVSKRGRIPAEVRAAYTAAAFG